MSTRALKQTRYETNFNAKCKTAQKWTLKKKGKKRSIWNKTIFLKFLGALLLVASAK